MSKVVNSRQVWITNALASSQLATLTSQCNISALSCDTV